MPVFLGSEFNVEWKGNPPGMSPLDYPIWQNFLARHSDVIKRVFYNVRVGGGSPPVADATPDEILMWLQLTMLRIDAVVETEREVWLIEVRPDAGRSAFGAAVIYYQLWAGHPPIDKPAVPVIATNNVTPQIKAIAELNNIRVMVV